MSKQIEALRLADCIDPPQIFVSPKMRAAAANELTRLHESNAYFQAAYGQELKTSNELRRANQALIEALKLIAETDVIDAALDPQRAVRVAQEAIAKGEKK